jgi:hypothetical protein
MSEEQRSLHQLDAVDVHLGAAELFIHLATRFDH